MMLERYCAVTFAGELGPGETRDLSAEVSVPFRAERLRFKRPPQTKAQRAAAWLLHLLKFPWLLGRSFRATVDELRADPAESFDEDDDDDFDDESDDSDRPRSFEERWRTLRLRLRDIWRAPWPEPPIDVLNIKVGASPQLVSGQPCPAELFEMMGPLVLETASAGVTLAVTVRNTSRQPFKVQGAFLGRAVVERPPTETEDDLRPLLEK